MATSGSVNLSTTRNDIIAEALEDLGVYDPGETIENHDIASCARTLNFMIKAWQADGIAIWKIKDIALFLGYEQYIYEIGPSGDHATETYVKTEIATAAASGAGSIVVDSIDGMTTGDYVGIELDDGTLQWTTINGVPAAATIVLTAVLTDSSGVNNHVYTYTTKANRPLEIIECRMHRSDGSEYPIEIVSRTDYTSLANKTQAGTPNQVYYQPTLTDGILKIWQAAGDVQSWLMMSVKDSIEDFDAATNNPDFPQEWFLPLATNLGIMVAPKFGVKASAELTAMASYFYESVSGWDQEHTSVRFGLRRD